MNLPSDRFESGLVSVVVPAFNAAPLIGETLNSVLSQTYSHIEVIVVDDGSTDATAADVQKNFPSVKLVRQANSGGCSSPRNHGLSVAAGEFVTFFDADDIMLPSKLEVQVEFLRRHENCLAVLMDYKNFDCRGTNYDGHFSSCSLLLNEQRRHENRSEYIIESKVARKILTEENFSSACSPLFRRSTFQKIGSFDEHLLASEDFDLTYRLALVSNLGIIDETGFLRRVHHGNMSHKTEHILQYKIASRAKLLRIEEDEECKRALQRYVAYRHREAVDEYYRLEPAKAARHLLGALKSGHPLNNDLAKALAKCGLGYVLSFGPRSAAR